MEEIKKDEYEVLAESELMKANEAATVAFGRQLRGYDVDEVDDFLDDVAESLHRYAELLQEKNLEIDSLRAKLTEYDSMRETLEETLSMTQEQAGRTLHDVKDQAEAMLQQAHREANMVIDDARERAAKAMAAAQENAIKMVHQAETLREQRKVLLDDADKLSRKFAEMLAQIREEMEQENLCQ